MAIARHSYFPTLLFIAFHRAENACANATDLDLSGDDPASLLLLVIGLAFMFGLKIWDRRHP